MGLGDMRCNSCGHELDECTCKDTPSLIEKVAKKSIDGMAEDFDKMIVEDLMKARDMNEDGEEFIKKMSRAPNSSSQPEITIETVRRMELREGDILFVTMSFGDLPPRERFSLAKKTRERIQATLKEAGYDCLVMIAEHGTTIDILSKEQVEKVMIGAEGSEFVSPDPSAGPKGTYNL